MESNAIDAAVTHRPVEEERERLRFASGYRGRDLFVGDVLGAEEGQQPLLVSARTGGEDGDRLVTVPNERDQEVTGAERLPPRAQPRRVAEHARFGVALEDLLPRLDDVG
jgi:hypothetical protein